MTDQARPIDPGEAAEVYSMLILGLLYHPGGSLEPHQIKRMHNVSCGQWVMLTIEDDLLCALIQYLQSINEIFIVLYLWKCLPSIRPQHIVVLRTLHSFLIYSINILLRSVISLRELRQMQGLDDCMDIRISVNGHLCQKPVIVMAKK